MLPFSIVVAFSKNMRGIGHNNQIPWNITYDTKNFKKITTTTINPNNKNAVIMGRKTFDSLPDSVKPLPGRVNVVISRSKELQNYAPGLDCSQNIILASSLENAIIMIKELENIEETFVIGGASIYKEAISLPNCKKIYATIIEKNSCNFDSFFPYIPDSFVFSNGSKLYTENQYEFRFMEYTRKV